MTKASTSEEAGNLRDANVFQKSPRWDVHKIMAMYLLPYRIEFRPVFTISKRWAEFLVLGNILRKYEEER